LRNLEGFGNLEGFLRNLEGFGNLEGFLKVVCPKYFSERL